MVVNFNKKSILFWLLTITIGFRSLVVPGLTPVGDDGSPLGFNITFCENLFESTVTTENNHGHDGHIHEHGNNDTSNDYPKNIPLSNHCTVSFIGGIFIEVPTFNVEQYLQLIQDQVKPDYTSPYTITPRYRYQLSRGPPESSVV